MSAPIIQPQFIQSNAVVGPLPDQNNTINAGDSGKTILLSTNAGVAGTIRIITLPAAQLGLRYTFVMSGPVSLANAASEIRITAGPTTMFGYLADFAGSTVTPVGGANNIRLLGGAAGVGGSVGDSVSVTCISVNPVQWSIFAYASGNNASAVN